MKRPLFNAALGVFTTLLAATLWISPSQAKIVFEKSGVMPAQPADICTPSGCFPADTIFFSFGDSDWYPDSGAGGTNEIDFSGGPYKWELTLDSPLAQLVYLELTLYAWGELGIPIGGGGWDDIVEEAISVSGLETANSSTNGYYGYFSSPKFDYWENDGYYNIIRYYTNFFAYVEYPAAMEVAYKLRITAIPEPAIWTYMLLGFGAAGAILRQRRRRAFTGTAVRATL